jgi:hypothetical protein
MAVRISLSSCTRWSQRDSHDIAAGRLSPNGDRPVSLQYSVIAEDPSEKSWRSRSRGRGSPRLRAALRMSNHCRRKQAASAKQRRDRQRRRVWAVALRASSPVPTARRQTPTSADLFPLESRLRFIEPQPFFPLDRRAARPQSAGFRLVRSRCALPSGIDNRNVLRSVARSPAAEVAHWPSRWELLQIRPHDRSCYELVTALILPPPR